MQSASASASATVFLHSGSSRLQDVLRAIASMSDVRVACAACAEPPNPRACLWAKEAALAVGALTPRGPKSVHVLASQSGGLVLIFPGAGPSGEAVIYAALNRGVVLLILGERRRIEDIQQLAPERAIAELKALVACREDEKDASCETVDPDCPGARGQGGADTRASA